MKEVLIGGIKVTLIGEDKVRPDAPLTIAVQVHGRTRSKTDCIKFAKLLQASVPDLICATWDLPNHGTRLVDPQANAGWHEGNDFHLIQMQTIIEQASTEAVTILQNICYHLPNYNICRKVIIGVSLGGYITWRVASNHSELLDAAVPIISSPNLPLVMETRFGQFKELDPEAASKIQSIAMPQPLMERLHAGVQKNNALQASELPILAICGGEDPLVPPQSTIEWGKNAAPFQRVEVVPGVKHEVPREIIDLTAEYLICVVSRLTARTCK